MVDTWLYYRKKLKQWHNDHLIASFVPFIIFVFIRGIVRLYFSYKFKKNRNLNKLSFELGNKSNDSDTELKRSIIFLHSLPNEYQKKIARELSTPSKKADQIIISLVGASRKGRNPNNRLNLLLDSLCNQTADLNRIEVIFRIDEDDDLLYYKKIYNSFGSKIRLQFVIGERKNYRNLHKLVSETLDYIAPSSKIVFGVADDCLITANGWDESFLHVLDSHPDNIFFINTLRDFSLPYESRYLFFWALSRHGPAAIFPAISRHVLDIIKQVIQKYPEWTVFGNSVVCDSFFETLQLYLWEITGERRVSVLLDTIHMMPDIVIPQHKEGGLFSESPVFIEEYSKFLTYPVQKIIQEISVAIAQQIIPQKIKPKNQDLKMNEKYNELKKFTIDSE